jgi:hypothetical protein
MEVHVNASSGDARLLARLEHRQRQHLTLSLLRLYLSLLMLYEGSRRPKELRSRRPKELRSGCMQSQCPLFQNFAGMCVYKNSAQRGNGKIGDEK